MLRRILSAADQRAMCEYSLRLLCAIHSCTRPRGHRLLQKSFPNSRFPNPTSTRRNTFIASVLRKAPPLYAITITAHKEHSCRTSLSLSRTEVLLMVAIGTKVLNFLSLRHEIF